jgi:superfamily II RNA helicase
VCLQDELLSTELLFRGLLSGLSPEEAVALMSALVFQVRQAVWTRVEQKNIISTILCTCVCLHTLQELPAGSTAVAQLITI